MLETLLNLGTLMQVKVGKVPGASPGTLENLLNLLKYKGWWWGQEMLEMLLKLGTLIQVKKGKVPGEVKLS